jgi:hypothetical protein
MSPFSGQCERLSRRLVLLKIVLQFELEPKDFNFVYRHASSFIGNFTAIIEYVNMINEFGNW